MIREMISYFVLVVFFMLLFLVIPQSEADAVMPYKGTYRGWFWSDVTDEEVKVKGRIDRAGNVKWKYKKTACGEADTGIFGYMVNDPDCGYCIDALVNPLGNACKPAVEFIACGDVDAELHGMWGRWKTFNDDITVELDWGGYFMQRVK